MKMPEPIMFPTMRQTPCSNEISCFRRMELVELESPMMNSIQKGTLNSRGKGTTKIRNVMLDHTRVWSPQVWSISRVSSHFSFRINLEGDKWDKTQLMAIYNYCGTLLTTQNIFDSFNTLKKLLAQSLQHTLLENKFFNWASVVSPTPAAQDLMNRLQWYQ